jgi:hypothetical protein
MIAGIFRPTDVVIAVVSTAGVQVALFLAFFSTSSSAIRANISDDNARPIAVAITPVSSVPGPPHRVPRLPPAWQRHARSAASAEPRASTKIARDTAEPPDQTEAQEATKSVEPAPPTTDNPERQDHAPFDDASPFENSDDGASDGDDASGLKTRAINLYRLELVSWFMSKFEIRGKLPFDTLKNLRAVATVSVSTDHTVTGYRLAVESENAVFDEQVRSTLTKIRESGAPLPPPPPLYPELLGSSLSVSFKCTARKDCE